MTLVLIVLGVLAMGAVLGAWRTGRVRGHGRWLRAVGSVVMAAGVALILFPPQWPQDRETLLVLAPGADAAAVRQRHPTLPAVALRGANAAGTDIETVPDLATALRRHPLAGSLLVVGDGLPARDREAVQDINLNFEEGAPWVGLVELQVPDVVHAGRAWTLRGAVARIADARVELRDRSDHVVAAIAVDAHGRFALQAPAKVEGQAQYRVRVLASGGAVTEEMPLVLNVVRGDPLQVLILAGGPDAELKYLRRWLVDSGNHVSSRIGLSRGIEQRQEVAAATPASLAEADVLIIDERAWASLSEAEKSAITEAVEQGLGVLLRVTGVLPAKVASEWAELGFRLEPTGQTSNTHLAGPSTSGDAIVLTRWPMRVVAARSASLQEADDGVELGRWRASGQGRVGVWLLLDSYRLVLRGESFRFESLWAEVLETVARARGVAQPQLPSWPRAGQRALICDLSGDAQIEDPQGNAQRLWVTPDPRACAAWWPPHPGNYTVVDPRGRWSLHVGETDPTRTLWRAETRRETQSLQRTDAVLPARKADVPRWLVFLIWLPLAGYFWWLERRRTPEI